MEALISWCCFLMLGLLMFWLTTHWEDEPSLFSLVSVMMGLSVTVGIVHTQLFQIDVSQSGLFVCYLVYPFAFVFGRLHADQSPRGQITQGNEKHTVSGQQEWSYVGKVVLVFSQVLYLCLMLGGCQAHEERISVPTSSDIEAAQPSSPLPDPFACGNHIPRDAFFLDANKVRVGEVVSCLPIAVCGQGYAYVRRYEDVPLTPGPYATSSNGGRTFTLECLVDNCGVAPDATTRCRIVTDVQ